MTTLTLTEAAELLGKSYEGRGAMPPLKLDKQHKYAQTYLTQDDILVIPGMNQNIDRLRGVDQWHVPGWFYRWGKYNKDISKSTWLNLFVHYTLDSLKLLGTQRPKFILGHSLGAGMTQILAQHYKVPAICFAVPAVCDGRKLTFTPYENILNVQIEGDWLPALLHDKGVLQRFGRTETVPPPAGHASRHKITSYIAAMQAGHGSLPPHWPLSGSTGRSGGGG